MKNRDRRLTPTSTSLAAGWTEAVHREGTELKAGTASAFYLDGKGTSKDSNSESMDTARLIANNNPEMIKNLKKIMRRSSRRR